MTFSATPKVRIDRTLRFAASLRPWLHVKYNTKTFANVLQMFYFPCNHGPTPHHESSGTALVGFRQFAHVGPATRSTVGERAFSVAGPTA